MWRSINRRRAGQRFGACNGGRAWAQLFTFLVVVFTLVLFRAETVTSAAYLYRVLFDPGQGGFVAAYSNELAQTNMALLLDMIGLGGSAAVMVFACIALAIAACWLLPSTWQLFQAYDVAFDKPPAGRPAVWRLQWRPGLGWSIFIAALFVSSCLNLTQVSDFLYFQF